jgi:glycosyl transferase, family 25
MQNVPVYVVSLKSATERRALIQEHLQNLGIAYELIDAVKGDSLDTAYRKVVNPTGNMSPGALGCYISHISIYKRIIENHIPVALILEDDTVLHYSVKALVDDGCQSLDFDYCFLGSEDIGDEGYVFYDSKKPVNLSSQHEAYFLSSGPYCLNAYLITLEGAKKRMSCAFPAHAPIDLYHFLPYRPRFMAIIPMLAFVNELSAVESMSSMAWSGLIKRARKYWWYYPLRDIVKLKAFKKLHALRTAKLPRSGRWRPFESAFKVVPQKRYLESPRLP